MRVSNERMSSSGRQMDPLPSGEPEQDERYRLDPSKFPKRVDLELSEELMQHLEAMAARSGRSINDLITDLLSRQVDPLA